MPKTLITGGTVVTAADTFKADVLIDGEKVAAVGVGLNAAGAKRIDASRKYVIPGGIDVHTHMELPFGGTMASDDFETGTTAAAFGGTTTIVDFAVQGFGESLEKARDAWMKKARGKAVVDYGLHMIVRDVSDKVLREMGAMVKDGISSFKLFMAYPGVFMVDDAATCPQYLFLSYDNYEEPGFDGAKYVMSPPLRPAWHQDELWKGLQRNDLQVVSTDHCPFCMKEGFQGLPKQKELGKGDFSKIPNGAPGVETRMVLLYDGGVVAGRITLNRWIELTSTTPAKIMGMFPKKGTIAVGSDADIVLWDPRTTSTISAKTHHMRVDYNPYEGRRVKGKASVVLSRGEVIVEKDEFLGKKGRGRFIKRGSPLLQT